MRVVTFGELMLRLSTPGHQRFVQADSFDATYGGCEANVAVAVANYGGDAAFVTKLPSHEVGQAALNALRRYGVDTTGIVRGGKRIGLYYLETGASQRPSKVIYDRAGSAFAEAEPTEYDWGQILSGADWFHISGITPALSDGCLLATLDACHKAREMGITVSCDTNYRKALWTLEKASENMAKIMEYTDVLISNKDDIRDLFGICPCDGAEGDEIQSSVAKQTAERFHLKYVAFTIRRSVSASDNDYAGMLYHDGVAEFSRNYPMHIVDRVGGGDSFAAGLIWALTEHRSPARAIEFATAAGVWKHSVEGDCNLATVGEIDNLANGDGAGRIRR